MRTSLLTFALLIATPLLALAGGNTSVVDLHSISSIKIEKNRILIVGSGMLRKRVMSDAAHGDSTCFGQPTQMLHAKVTDCTFEIVPYHVDDELIGVPGPAPKDMTPKMIAQSEKWWADTLAHAQKIKVGDAVTIGYQREKMTLRSVYVTKIIGSGSVRVSQKK